MAARPDGSSGGCSDSVLRVAPLRLLRLPQLPVFLLFLLSEALQEKTSSPSFRFFSFNILTTLWAWTCYELSNSLVFFFIIITFPKCVTWGHCGILSDPPSWFQGPSSLHQHIQIGLPTSRSLLIASPRLDEGLTRSSTSAVATHCRAACWSPSQPWRTFSPQQLLTAKSLVGIFKLRILRQSLMQDNYFCHSICSPVRIPSNWKVM